MQNVLTQMKTKKANKGFTMVELIIVIAIIAVLAAVLAPQYLRFVEESKVSTDKQMAATIEAGINVLIADGTIELPTATAAGGTSTVTWTTATGVLGGTAVADIDTTSGATAAEMVTALKNQLNVQSDSALQATSSKGTENATITWTITHYNTGNITITSSVDYKTWA